VAETDDPPPVDPDAVRSAYRLHRARRHARVERHRRARRASIRFWVTLLVLVAGAGVLALVIYREVQGLFGI
jgi:hypothetical protein